MLFTDVEMPTMSGFDLVKGIRANGTNPKVVFVTGFDHYAIKAIREQAFDYLTKPVDVDDLRKMVDRLLGTPSNSNDRQEQIIKEFQLTNPEGEILKGIFDGKKSQEIAEALFVSKHTIDTHRRNILNKIGVKSTKELMLKYI